MIEIDDLATRSTDTPHLTNDLNRIGHDADHVRRIDDVERVVGEREVGGIHLHQTHVLETLALDALARLLEHRRGEVDPRDVAIAWIERSGDAGADADL